jgi:hypothetical protein
MLKSGANMGSHDPVATVLFLNMGSHDPVATVHGPCITVPCIIQIEMTGTKIQSLAADFHRAQRIKNVEKLKP